MKPLLGHRLSHYLVLEELGRGGMGVAYRAEDLNLGRQVVLKVLPREAALDSTRLERFRREARACSALEHPGITAVYEASQAEGIYYICMEFVQGRTLRRMLDEGPLPPGQALDLAGQVADAVAAAHGRGIVHRDLKPENIMVAESGAAKVLDFGLAAMATVPAGSPVGDLPTQAERLTSAGTRMGTPTYMSPEQARARPAGPPSDVFALGGILYEMIAGHPPFRGDTDLAILHAISYDNPAPLRARRPGTPRELEAIVRRALRKDPADRYPDAAALRDDITRCRERIALPGEAEGARSRPQPGAVAPAGATGDSPLVGRAPEMERLRQALRLALEGRGQLALISGEAGIGKSRLVAECGRIFEGSGAVYAVGRCLFREGSLPYHPFVEAAGRIVTLLGIDSADDLEAYVRERMPSLRGRLPILLSFLHLPGSLPSESEQASNREHLLDAIAAFFVQVTRERPVLLHIDDLHWADEATLDLFTFLARGFRRTRGVLVGAYRPEETPEMVTRLSAGDEYIHLRLERLGPEETAAILRAEVPGARVGADLLERLHRNAAGNPFFVLEAIRLLKADGLLRLDEGQWLVDEGATREAIPGRVQDLMERRLSRLMSPERQLLEAAACEGMTFRSATLESCLERERYSILSTLQALDRKHRLIRTEDERYRFDHPLIREALYESIIPELRREYHRRIAEHLIHSSRRSLLAGLGLDETREAGTLPARRPSAVVAAERRTEAAAIAFQLLSARERDRAVPYLIVSAIHARRLFANREAEASLDQALQILQAGGGAEDGVRRRWLVKALKDRGRIRVRLGAFEDARRDFLTMRENARAAGFADKEAHAETLLADMAVRTGDYVTALEHAETAARIAESAGDRHSLASALSVMGVVHFSRGNFEESLAAHSRSLSLSQSIGDTSGYADNLNKVGNLHLRQGRTEEALAAYSTALEIARDGGHRLWEAEALNNIGAVHHERGDLGEALRHYRSSLSLKREIGDQRSIARSQNNIGLLHEARAEFKEALQAHEESLALKRELGDQSGIASSLSNLGGLFEQIGAYRRAVECAEESLAIKQEIGESWTVPYCQNALGRVRLALQDLAGAEILFRAALEGTREHGDRSEECRARANLAAVMIEAGRAGEALECLQALRSQAETLGLQEMLAEAFYLSGRAAAAAGDLEAADAALRDLGGIRPRVPFARAAVQEGHLRGILHRARGDEAAARSVLEEAAETARRTGLKGLAWRILAEAGRATEARAILQEILSRLPEGESRDRFLRSPEVASLGVHPSG